MTAYMHGVNDGRDNCAPARAPGFLKVKLADGSAGYQVSAAYLDGYVRGRIEATVRAVVQFNSDFTTEGTVTGRWRGDALQRSAPPRKG